MLLTRAPLYLVRRPFALDLHVLGAPPTFVLSQDQTLQFKLGKLLDYCVTRITQQPQRLLTRDLTNFRSYAIQFSKTEARRPCPFSVEGALLLPRYVRFVNPFVEQRSDVSSGPCSGLAPSPLRSVRRLIEAPGRTVKKNDQGARDSRAMCRQTRRASARQRVVFVQGAPATVGGWVRKRISARLGHGVDASSRSRDGSSELLFCRRCGWADLHG